MMKIAIFTLGTRGDVQPFAILGRALKKRGHEVTLSTGKNFESLVRSYGIEFVSVEADFQAMINSEEGRLMKKNPLKARKQIGKVIFPMLANAFVAFYELSKKNDLVLFHVKTMADNFADQFPGKMFMANVVPATQATREFPNPVFSALPLPRFLNKFSYKLTDWGLAMWQKAIDDFRNKAGLPRNFIKPQLPSIYGISPLFLKKPDDYPANAHFTGFWTAPGEEELDQEIVSFIHAGEPPVLITFGSMPFESKLNLIDALTAVTQSLGVRLLVIKGWGITIQANQHSFKDILVVESAPYDKLMPMVKAVVHHGGIGTMAACLQAGKPFMTCPVLYPLGDQHFWGTIAFKKGVALKPIPLKKLTQAILNDGIRELIHNQELHARAKRLAEQLKNEDGIQTAIEIIENPDLRQGLARMSHGAQGEHGVS